MLMSEKKVKADSPTAVAKILHALLISENETGRDQEHFWVLGLNTKNVVMYIDLVSLGTVSEALVHPREVYRMAILKGVSGIIAVHNHPSGDMNPSADDIRTYKRLSAAGDIIGIEMLDGLIVSNEGNFVSFKEGGYL